MSSSRGTKTYLSSKKSTSSLKNTNNGTNDFESNFYKHTGLERPEGWECNNQLYYCLNLEGRSATKEEIKNAYFSLAKIWHPDKHKNDQDIQIARDQFEEINFAYNTLMDPVRRKIYDLYGLKGLENQTALLKFTKPRNIDDPTPIELLVGGQNYKSKMEEKELLLQHKLHTSKAKIKFDALDIFKSYEKDKEIIKGSIMSSKEKNANKNANKSDKKIQPYAVKLETEVNFPGFLTIENLNLRNHFNIDLETDVVETLVGSDLTYDHNENHRFELQNYWEIDTIGYLTSDSDPVPNKITSAFLYEYRAGQYVFRNFLPAVFVSRSSVGAAGQSLPLQISPGTNNMSFTFPFLRQDAYHYFSSIKLQFNINLFRPLNSEIYITMDNVITDDKYLIPGTMVQMQASPGFVISLRPDITSGVSPISKELTMQVNLGNKTYLDFSLNQKRKQMKANCNQKITKFTTVKTGIILENVNDEGYVSLVLGVKKAGLDLTLPILTSNDSDLKYACLLAAGTAIAIASIKHLYEDYLKHQKKALIDKFKFDYDNESIKNKIFSFFGKSENEKKVEILEKKRIRYEQIVKAEKKAEGILKLLSATFRNKVVEAEKENGLIILEAYYGDFMGFGYAEHKRNGQQQHKGNGDSSMSSPSPLNKTEEDLVYNHRNKNSKNFAINYNKSSLLQQNFNELKNYIDIKIQLQCMVHNNKLQIPKNSYLKDRIVDGFYDPSMDVSEVPVCLKVKIKYSFRGKKFKCEYNDGDKISLPKKADEIS